MNELPIIEEQMLQNEKAQHRLGEQMWELIGNRRKCVYDSINGFSIYGSET